MNKSLSIAAIALAMSGCAAPAPPAPLATEDLNVGISKTCTATPIDLSASTTANATIEMTNDGWCAVHAKERGGQPFQLGLLRARPQHGRVLIQKIGGETRIEYTAENRYVGADRFTVSLRSSVPNATDSTVNIMVLTTMGEGLAPTPVGAAPVQTRPHSSPSRSPSQSKRPN